MEAPWYDAALLEKHFDKFHEGEVFQYDSDEFSLPEPGEEGDDDVTSDADGGEDNRAGAPRPAGAKSETPVDERSVHSNGSRASISKRQSPLMRPPSELSATPDDNRPKSLKSHASSSAGSQTRKPIAGFSVVDKPVIAIDSPALGIDVRQKGYKKTGRKAPSEASLYEFVAMDILRGKKKISKVYSHVAMPWLTDEKKGTGIPGVPFIVVINIQLPNKGPAMFRSSSDTDPGTSLVFYFRFRKERLDDPALRLAAKFFTGNAPGKFKVIASIDNLSELKFPSMLASTMNKFNGKPIIIHKTGSFFNDKDVSEIDVDVFQFPVMARTALASGRSVSQRARLRVAFVLQGDSDDELPERLLGCCELRGLDLDSHAFDKFT